jgi:hypothetical protein
MSKNNFLVILWRRVKTNPVASPLVGLGLAFWLPLPLIGLSIWFGGKSVANQMLSYQYNTQSYLEANYQVKVKLSVAVIAIKAEIKEKGGFTKVIVKTADSAIKTLDIAALEAGITKELGLDITTVKRLTRYQFVD